MRILYDDRELVKELMADKTRLIEELKVVREQSRALLESLKQLANQAARRREVPARYPVPDDAVALIDWERLGLKPPQTARQS